MTQERMGEDEPKGRLKAIAASGGVVDVAAETEKAKRNLGNVDAMLMAIQAALSNGTDQWGKKIHMDTMADAIDGVRQLLDQTYMTLEEYTLPALEVPEELQS